MHPRLALGEFKPERDWIQAPALCDFVEGLSAAKALWLADAAPSREPCAARFDDMLVSASPS